MRSNKTTQMLGLVVFITLGCVVPGGSYKGVLVVKEPVQNKILNTSTTNFFIDILNNLITLFTWNVDLLLNGLHDFCLDFKRRAVVWRK